MSDTPQPPRRRYTPPREERVHFRASPAEIAAWQAAADTDGRTLSDWMRRQLNAAATGSPHPPRK